MRCHALALFALTLACGRTPPAQVEPDAALSAPVPSVSATLSPVPLLQRYPALAARLTVLPIGRFPTPVHKAERLGQHLGMAKLYLKRDDLSDPDCGGSKTRKLAFLFGQAVRAGHKKVITFGGVGSNHALATAHFASRAGLEVTLMLAPETPSPDVRDHLLIERATGAELILMTSVSEARLEADRLVRSSPPDRRPYVIAPGGSSPLGNLGYVNAAFELARQVEQGQLPEPDVIYVAMGTMGTAVGLRIGLRAAGLKSRLIAVRASSTDAASERKMVEMFVATVAYLRALDPSFPALSLGAAQADIRHGYVGEGYARPTRKGREAMLVFRQYADIELDSTYTAKAFAAVIDDAALLRDQVVLFWNTQGTASKDLARATEGDLPAGFQPYLRAGL